MCPNTTPKWFGWLATFDNVATGLAINHHAALPLTKARVRTIPPGDSHQERAEEGMADTFGV